MILFQNDELGITITGYYNSNPDSLRFCLNIGPNQAITVYYSGSGTKTFLQAYNSGSTIFSDTALKFQKNKIIN